MTFNSIAIKFSEKASYAFDFCFKWINKLKWIIVVFWIIVALGMVYCVFGFLKHTSMVVSPPKGSLGWQANKIYNEKFPNISGVSQVAVVIKQMEQLDDINNSTYLLNFSTSFNQSVMTDEKGYLVRKIVGRYIIPQYSTFIEKFIAQFMAKSMVSGEVTLIEIELSGEEPTAVGPYVKRMRKYISDYKETYGDGGYDFAITGYDALGIDLQSVVIKALEKMELIVFPIALIILLYVVQSPVLLIIPIVNVIIIILTSFGLMYPISITVDVFGITPAMMMSTIAATAIDYSLFLLTRYTEEINKKQSYYDAVSNMLRTSGRIVGTSGFVMLFCFSVIAIFPFDIVRYIGIGCTISVTITLVVDLTMTPALFLCFPRFFKLQSCIPCYKKCVKFTQRRARFQGVGDQMWHKFATFQSKKPVAATMFCLGLIVMIPFCVFIYRFEWTLDNNQVVPLETEFNRGFVNIQESFPIGILYPFHLLIESDVKTMDVISNEYYNFTRQMISVFSEQMSYAFDNTSVICFNAAGGKVISPKQLQILMTKEGYQNAMESFLSKDSSVVNCQLIPKVDPTNNSTLLIADIRDHFTQLESEFGYKILIQGIIVDGVDCVNASMRYFILVLIVLVIVILIMVLIFFKSALVPLRVVFTTCLTLTFVYGAASLIFCTDYFDSIDVIDQTKGIYWVVPIISVPIICGLSLDYDIFLFSRIREYRTRGYSTSLATVYGVERTGYLITFCGIIMAVAFSGLFLAGVIVLDLFAFVLTLAVLSDTFLVRTLLVPSFVHLFGELNWWPIKYEINTTEYENADEFHIYDHLDSSSTTESEDNSNQIESTQQGTDSTPLLN
ncbi:MmpL efflux pump, putative [Entamoeba histolytica HM-1:IMSS-B]|uniref:MmpL efflux pump, putative n=6 Tax=Entamoeba histolytica TaxID=5759 RepID=C4LZY4_ENTH1|nr:MmpL efflux pump, putative [Entamoeba histolytica HM-1:IMSS]EMD47041.1 MmpL efflux pump, putative [Entamoeba histolytica KU27]EMH74948.1 MmpL efflux pump, putative [Entamoeba histolytica HM-1:IMSS-B]EMS14173.1 MmpL efflux pump, putative [Entamoeba histolytica HM-3:IMSS]ENY62192.1 MmpL efflux pump, putative [Entamoeba histolytica HM-1:IMSS-A]GAT94447.1 mmpl efflux pump putative [Entamoeba histolytica]|eukprot:XP_653644.1 MmpL efflux pump, putative [Entamoeba histolytica HM-1:IMSS]